MGSRAFARSACCWAAAVPVLWQGPFAMAAVQQHAGGKTAVDDQHIREGVVVRPLHERNDPRIGRVVMEYLADAYLLDDKHSDFTEAQRVVAVRRL